MVLFKYGRREDTVGPPFHEWEVYRLLSLCAQFCSVSSSYIGKTSTCQAEVPPSEGVQWHLGKGIWKVSMWPSPAWKQGGNSAVSPALALPKWLVKSHTMSVSGFVLPHTPELPRKDRPHSVSTPAAGSSAYGHPIQAAAPPLFGW